MDPHDHRMVKSGDQAADESAQAGWWMVGGTILILGGIILIFQANASVADFGGAMLLLIGVAAVAGSLWIYGQSD